MRGSNPVIGNQVLDGVGWIAASFVNCYTVQDGPQTYLIDTGLSRRAGPIERAIRNAGASPDQITKILLTHHHLDHMGGAAYLIQSTRASLECHEQDALYVDGRAKAPMPFLMRLFARVHPAPVAVMLKEGDRVGPLSVLHVPGHTPGEVAFYDSGRQILFSGDSVVESRGRLTLPAPRIASNLEQAIGSLSRLRGLPVECLLPGHGRPVRRDVAGLLDDLIRRAPKEYLKRP